MKFLKTFSAALVLSFAAFAQAPDVAPVPAANNEVIDALAQLLGAAKVGQTALAIVLGLVIVVRLASKYGTKLPGKVGEWFGTPAATWIFPMVLSISGALATTLAVPGASFSVPVLLSAILVGLASGGQGAAKAAVNQANKAADAAAGEVKTVSDAAAVIRKGPEA